MANKTPEQLVEKYQRGVQGAGQDYANGVANPSRPWDAATIASASRWRNSLQEAMTNGSFQKGVQKAGNARWQQRATQIGAQRYASSASEAAQAYQAKAAQIVAAGNAARAAANAMPNDTLEARLQRMVSSARAISNFWKGRTG